ncbi:MAG: chromosomal replication initiator DnaA [Sphingobium sp.]
MSQIGLPFDWEGQHEGAPFLVSPANQDAVRFIEHWTEWPIPIAILSGPSRSGRSTLGRQFAHLSNGTVIDDAEEIADQTLFHAWNQARDSGRPLLMIARSAPTDWQVGLPDLRSRLLAAPHIRLAQPDDELVRALIEAGLGRGGSAFSADLPEWLARRIERSYATVAAVLATLNRDSLSSGRKISVAFARESLQRAEFLRDDEPGPTPDPNGE